jgi:hypothetical protein
MPKRNPKSPFKLITSSPYFALLPGDPPKGCIVLGNGEERPVVSSKKEAYADLELCRRELKLYPPEYKGIQATIANANLPDGKEVEDEVLEFKSRRAPV